MTNRIKTVQNPRAILIACKNSKRIAEIISDILNFCSYNTCIDDFSQNTDFVIENRDYDDNCPENVIADTILFDGDCEIDEDRMMQFREKVTSYENAMRLYGDDFSGVITFSADNYGADVACRNVSEDNGTASFEIIGNGILSRVNIIDGKYSVEEVLACTGVLLAIGMPMASVLSFFDYEEK